MEYEINELLKILIDEDLIDFKCFDLLKQKIIEDEVFREKVKEGIKEGFIKKFPRELFDKVCNQNIRAPFEPIQIFIDGANLGNCTVMSKMISYSLDYCYICGGTLESLIGTKNSPDGRHTWVSYNNNVIDPTFMIQISENYIKNFGYNEENRYNPNQDMVYCSSKEYANDPNLKSKKSM